MSSQLDGASRVMQQDGGEGVGEKMVKGSETTEVQHFRRGCHFSYSKVMTQPKPQST